MDSNERVISICRKRVPIEKQIVVIYAAVGIVLYWKRPHGIRYFWKLNRDTPLRTLAGLTGSWCQKVRERPIDLINSGIEPRVVVGPMDLQR